MMISLSQLKVSALSFCFLTFSTVAAESKLTFLNEFSLPTSRSFQDVLFGGLSGITYNPETNVYYAISDARNTRVEGQSRFYELKINTTDKGIQDVKILAMKEMKDEKGTSFKEQEVDAEGIVLSPDRKSLLWVSELGSALRKSSLDGLLLKDYNHKIPKYYNAGGELKKSDFGLRSGLSFEGISLTPDGKHIYLGAETALKQDGNIATTLSSSPTRILKYGIDNAGNVGELQGEYIYNVDPIPHVSRFGINDNGLSDIIAVSDDKLLVIERSGRNASEGFKNWDFSIKVYIADLSEATNIKGISSLSDIENKSTLQTASKKLLIDFADYTDAPDCIEGVTFGPELDGKKTIIFVSDNNFQPYQKNKFFMFVDTDDLLK
ncbi:TPA: esterase-like activity of phytase family protein [Klebsiella variicola]|nr:esterase-like activity of phytase family protein [Klebsiella variicola]